MTDAIQISRHGGPEVLRRAAIELPAPAPNEVRLRQTAIGLNFADVYMRTGNHPLVLPFPATLGFEAAGIVEVVGRDVSGLAVGDRVGYFGVVGAYVTSRNVAADQLVKLPGHISDETAAAILAKGVTAQYLCKRAYPVSSRDTVLIHAAAGGVGTILAQWAASLGAVVIGTVGSEEKAAIARANGCAHAIVATKEDFVAGVEQITKGLKCTVVFDALGGDTSVRSLDCLRPRGTLVCFGRTVAWPAPIEPGTLMAKGSLVLMMTQLRDFASTRADIEASTRDLFDAVAAGAIKPVIHQRYALRDAEQAHRDLENRKTIGSTILYV